MLPSAMLSHRLNRSSDGRAWRRVAVLALACCLPVLAGCQIFASMFYLFSPEQTRTIEAEYAHLEGQQTLILVWADDSILFDFPYVQFELAEFVRSALISNVRGVEVVSPRSVATYQAKNPNWTRQHPTEIAKQFRADRVVMIELIDYRTREPQATHLLRGHISANVRVYDAEYGTGVGPVWTSDDPVEVNYPEDQAGTFGVTDEQIRRTTMQLFAAEVAGKFYDRKVKE